MHPEALKLISQVKESQRAAKILLDHAQRMLDEFRTKCHHQFVEIYDPVSTDVQAREDRWKRTCSICGLTQFTTLKEIETRARPRW